MKLSFLLKNIPSDDYLTELWPASEYLNKRRKGPYISRQELIVLALHYNGYHRREIIRALDGSAALLYRRLPITIEKLRKVHVIDDIKKCPVYKRITPEVMRHFDRMKPKISVAELCRREWRIAADELEQVIDQRDILLRYLIRHSDIDIDLCMREDSAARCPNHAHCEDSDQCRMCILSHLQEIKPIR